MKKCKEEKNRRHGNPKTTEEVQKKSDVISKARNKFFTISDSMKSNKHLDVQDDARKGGLTRSMTQVTLDYFFKHFPPNKNHVYENSRVNATKSKGLRKQNSIDSYPIRIEITDEDGIMPSRTLDRNRPATVCVDKLEAPRDTEALALERPKKKLSFKVPEISSITRKNKLVNGDRSKEKSGSLNCIAKLNLSVLDSAGIPRNRSFNGIVHHEEGSWNNDELDELESQAMRVVRTIGQAFEVCHKLSINSPPENEHLDPDEQDTLTQDLLSDRLSDITSDKHKRDLNSEGASDRMSLPPDDSSLKDSDIHNRIIGTSPQLEILPPPPNKNSKKLSLAPVETYAAPHSDALSSTAVSSSVSSSSLPPVGSPLSAHHELQLMREQLEQQQQQTREAVAQLQLVREQLAAEQSARLEAQARTHQLLVHNRELLDHIAALVAHLQGGDKTGQQPTPPHMTMPQHQQPDGSPENYASEVSQQHLLDSNPLMQTYGWNPQNLIENRCVTKGLPSSPLRSSFNPAGSIFNFGLPPPVDSTSYESQLMQTLHALGGYASPTLYPYHLPQAMPFLPASLYGHSLLNNNYPLQMPPQKKINPPQVSGYRNSYPGSVAADVLNSTRNSEPRQLSSTPQYQANPVFQYPVPVQQNYQQDNPRFQNEINVSSLRQSQPVDSSIHNSIPGNSNYDDAYLRTKQSALQSYPQNNLKKSSVGQNQSVNNLKILQNQHKEKSPNLETVREGEGSQFIKPLPQVGTLATTDSQGRLRVVGPVPSDETNAMKDQLANLRLGNTLKLANGPTITRSSSERVPNRSELMSQVQRTLWARHTTK